MSGESGVQATGNASTALYDFSRPPYLTHVADEYSQGKYVNNFVKGCKWAPDGSCVLTNSSDCTLRIFNAPDLSSLPSEPQKWASALCVREVDLVYDYCWYPKMSSLQPETACFLTTAKTAPIHLWDAFTGALRASYIAKDYADAVTAAHSVAVDPGGEVIYAGYKNALRAFDIACPGEQCTTINLSTKNAQQGGIISSIAFDPSGVDLIALGSYNRSIGIYTAECEVMSLLNAHSGGITQLTFSQDGRKLYSGARMDPCIFCWDLRMGKVLKEFRRDVDTNQRIAFDIDQKGMFLVSGMQNGILGVWDLQTEDRDGGWRFQVHGDMVNGVSWHPVWPVMVTASGQRHCAQLADEDGEVEGTECVDGEYMLKLWYVG